MQVISGDNESRLRGRVMVDILIVVSVCVK